MFNALAGESAHRSGIAGQVLLVQFLAPGQVVVPPVPLQVRLLVFAKRGQHVRLVGKFETAQDGTFLIELPPGTYVVEPDPLSGYAGFGQLQVTVAPRQIMFDEIDVVPSPFPV
jgi:hypothetical protein